MSENTLHRPEVPAAVPPSNGAVAVHPEDRPLEDLVGELIELEKHFPPPDQAAQYADCRWLNDNWGTAALEPYRGTHVVVYNGAVVGSGDNPTRLELDAVRTFNVHPQRLVVEYIPRRGEF